jgi:hypothetical protein
LARSCPGKSELDFTPLLLATEQHNAIVGT